VDEACESAKTAFSGWARLPQGERAQCLQRLQSVFKHKRKEIAEAISRDVGKPLWESLTEADALVSKITITLEESSKLIDPVRVDNALPGILGWVRYKPRGVMAVLGPFNFPLHLPNGHIVPALLAGNTIVFKPSEQAPYCAEIYSQCFAEAGFPAGVFNMIQGMGESGRKLALHEGVDGILFTGSYEVGLRIKQETLSHYWKILALEMGGKNAAVVMEDADLDKAVYECLIGAYLTSGQRCASTSRLFLHEKIKDEFIEKFYQRAKKLSIGHWQTNPFMGPLISEGAVEKYLRFQEIAQREGAESLMRGKPLEVGSYRGFYVTPSIHEVKHFNPDSVYQKTEVFGPNVAIFSISDYEQSILPVNSTGFGLVASIFTQNKTLYERALLDYRVGLLNWNRSTNGASSRLPFGGMGKSGNDRPSAHFAIYYCSVPVASLEDTTAFDSAKVLPGMNL
jgi:succinylglutamic semialdehyde dehydrogenase